MRGHGSNEPKRLRLIEPGRRWHPSLLCVLQTFVMHAVHLAIYPQFRKFLKEHPIWVLCTSALPQLTTGFKPLLPFTSMLMTGMLMTRAAFKVKALMRSSSW